MNKRLGTWRWAGLAALAIVQPLWSSQASGAQQAPGPAAHGAVTPEPPQPPAGPPAPPPPPDSAVEAILATNPTTPADLAESAKILADLHRPDLAKGLLQKFLAAKPGAKELAGLQSKFGSLLFVSLASRPELAPEGRQVANLVLDAVSSQLRDPTRLAALIHELQNPSPDVQFQALDSLRRAGPEAVGPMLAVLVDTKRAAQHSALRGALARMGADAVGPLVAAVDSPDVAVKTAAIAALGDTGRRDSALYLLAPYASQTAAAEVHEAAASALGKLLTQLPAPQAAAALLADRAEKFFNRGEPLPEDAQGLVEIWTWDPALGQPVRTATRADDARRWWAARLARDAYRIEPGSPSIEVLYLATMLEAAAYAKGLDQPLPATDPAVATATAMGIRTTEEVLRSGMEAGHTAAATVAARILGGTGLVAELLYRGPEPSPLSRAVESGDRRLRFAAAQAILKLKPDRTFAGASSVPKALSFFASSKGRPRVIVAGASTEESRRIGGYLNGMGFVIDTATTGRGVVEMAIGSPDYEFILVDSAIERPTADFLLQELRRDYRTADVPVGVLARDGRLPRAENIVRNDRLAAAFSRPHNPEAGRWQIGQLRRLAGDQFVPAAVRQIQASEAMAGLVALSDQKSEVHENLDRLAQTSLAALSNPALRARAIVLLGRLGTPGAQTALVDMASRATLPFEVRRAAAAAFCQNVADHDVLLTTDQIRLQYDRYNASRTADRATQTLLGSILDCLELRNKPLGPGNAGAPARGAEPR